MSQAVHFGGTERFEIVRRLGAGGMGVVYEALDRERKTRVALKTLRALDGGALLRFKNEFRALADLQHPNLVRLGELVEEHGTWFFTMELLPGTDFLAWVRPGGAERPSSERTTEKRPAHTTAVAHVDPRTSLVPETHSGALDEPHLRDALLQLAQGLRALHAAGMIHRDVKPSNVLVTEGARVVLLDFGLVAPALEQENDVLAGTVAYMAPEQADGGALGPAADWYALGVMLYEALTGRLPFHGSAFELLRSKRSLPEDPRSLAPDAPEDLCALAMDLLQPNADARPTGDDVVRRLGAQRSTSMPPSAQSTTFVGRERELDQLRRAWESSRAGRAVTVYVHGESGVGKTALVRTFAARLAQSDREVVVLSGRCYERESVPYKAVDGVVDSLSRLLGRLPRDDADEVLPPNAHLLSQLFPVLGHHLEDVPAPDSQLDPAELRARAFAVLRELLARVAQKFHAVVVIDDLQWADPDSLVALRDIMMPPAPPVLLIATVRTTSGSESARSMQIPTSRLNVGSSAMPGDVRDIPLGRLGRAEALELARQAAAQAGASPDACEAIAEEAGGHPLFIDELARHAAAGGKADVKLEDAVWARIRAQEKRAQELVLVACVSGAPLPAIAAAHAAGFDDAQELDHAVGWLRSQHLVRTTRRRGVPSVEPYHDRVRQAVLAQLPEEREEIHRRIALGLEKAPTREPETLATHWLGAGDRTAAARYACEAADIASSALAFDRAARLYAWAIDLDPPAPADLSALEQRRGEALASAGRGHEAARAFLQAATNAPDRGEALDLRRRAAEHLLLSGRIDEGLAVLREVLAEVGLEMPATPARALASIAYRKARLRLRGLSYKPRANPLASDLRTIDVCWTASMGLGLVDTVRAADFHLRGVLLALGAGDARRISRALAIEGTYLAGSGAERRAWERFLERGLTLARELRDPHAIGIAIGARGMAAFLAGDFRIARTCCEEAIVMLREGSGMSWHLDMLRVFSLRSLWMLGETRTLTTELPIYLRDAENRGDLFFSTNLRTGYPCLAWLVVDDPDGARVELDAARASWSTQGVHLQHLQELQARAHVDLYEGQGQPALHRIEAAWPAIERAGHLRVVSQRIAFAYVRARACIAAAQSKAGDHGLLARATADANDIARTGAPWGLGIAALLRGAIAAASSDDIRARASFEIAARDLQACEMGMLAAVCRRRRGEILGGDEGRAQIEEADRWLKGQAVAKPDRISRMMAP